MPPKKKPDDDATDPIAQATDALLGARPSQAPEDESAETSPDSENAESRNSTISQTRNSASAPSGPSARSEATLDPSRGLPVNEEGEKDRLPGPYVPAEVSYALQEAQLRLRRMTGEKVSQSLIIQCALEICIAEHQERGNESALARLIAERVSS